MTKERLIASLAVTALLVAAVPAIAAAQTDEQAPPREERIARDTASSDDLERAKAHVIEQIERRLEALERLTAKIESAKHMTAEHAAALLDDIAAAQQTLRAGIPAVEAVTTPEELRAVAPPIFEGTLVFALLAPKTHEVGASDAVVAATGRFTEFASSLQDALDRIANETDVDTSEAQAKLDEMLRLIGQAATSGGAVADSVIDLSPEDWPDPAQAALREGKAALDEARGSLRQARGLGEEVVQFIRSVAGDPPNDAVG